MTGSRDKFHDDSDLDQLAHDLDLDRDAPIGTTFAAALRDQGVDLDLTPEEDLDLALDADAFIARRPEQAKADGNHHFGLNETLALRDPNSAASRRAPIDDDGF